LLLLALKKSLQQSEEQFSSRLFSPGATVCGPSTCSGLFQNAVVTVRPVLDSIPHRKGLLQATAEDDFSDLRRAEATGRPLDAPEFVAALERLLARKTTRRAPGRRPAIENSAGKPIELLGIVLE